MAFGHRERDVLSMPFVDLLRAPERSLAETTLFSERADREPDTWTLCDKAGREVLVQLKSTSIRMQNGFAGWTVSVTRVDGYHLLYGIASNPLTQAFFERAFIGIRIVISEPATGQHRLVYVNEVSRSFHGCDPSRPDPFMGTVPTHLFNFWEQGKEVQARRIAGSQLTHYYGIHSFVRHDQKSNFIRYVTCEAKSADDKFIRVIFEWDITDQVLTDIRKSNEPAKPNASKMDLDRPLVQQTAAWLSTIPSGALLLDDSFHLVAFNDMAAEMLDRSLLTIQAPLLNLVCPPWHPNVQSFIQHDLGAAQPSRRLRCNLLNGQGGNFPAELAWRKVQLGDTPHYVVMIVDQTESYMTARVVEKSTERERQHFGQTLHDDIGQHASAIAIMTSALRLRDGIPAEYDGILATIEKSARDILGTARSLSHGLMSIALGSKSLASALNDLCLEMRRLRDWHCEVIAPESIDIRADHSAVMFRIAREAAENALRYSQASSLTFELKQRDTTLQLAIIDNGIGLPLNGNHHGTGLHSMKLSAQSLGGFLDISSEPGKGVAITCSIPIAC